jgi:phosphinothricin acetyltransferase
MPDAVAVREANSQDGEALAAIYNHYIAETIITFEESPVAAADMAQRVADTRDDGLPWLVAMQGENVAGYAYASKWKGRCAYRYATEITVYLDQGCSGQGIGSLLYQQLFEELRDRGMHTVIAGIALPNDASIALHEKMGLEKVAHFKEVGRKFDRWIDVGYWQANL